MQCPNCSAQMGLEDAVCPYCGTPNAMAAQHQSDMNRYRQDYQRTKADVIEKTSFMQSTGGTLIVLAALLVGLVIGIIVWVNAWDIGYSIRVGNVESGAVEDQQAMNAYLEQGDYGQFQGYYEANSISLTRDNPYEVLHSAASAYVDLLQYVSIICDKNHYAMRPERIPDTCASIAYDLNRIYTAEQQYAYDLDRYLPAEMRPYLEDICDRAAAISKAYLGLTDEQIADIPNLSERRLAKIIEEGMSS